MSARTIKLGSTWLQLRDKPLNPPIKLEKTLLKEEVARLRNQVDVLVSTLNIEKKVTDLHNIFFKQELEVPEPKRRLTKKEKLQLEIQKRIEQNELAAIQKLVKNK